MKKTLSILLGLLLLLALIAGAWYLVQQRLSQQAGGSETTLQKSTGAVVRISDDRKQITIKSTDGNERTFTISATVPFVALAPAGQTGKQLSSLSVGDVLEVTAKQNDDTAANKLELIPTDISVLSSTSSIESTLVSATATSITVTLINPPGMPGMPTTRTFVITKDTQILTEVQKEQVGKMLGDAAPGAKVKVYATALTPDATALAVLLRAQ